MPLTRVHQRAGDLSVDDLGVPDSRAWLEKPPDQEAASRAGGGAEAVESSAQRHWVSISRDLDRHVCASDHEAAWGVLKDDPTACSFEQRPLPVPGAISRRSGSSHAFMGVSSLSTSILMPCLSVVHLLAICRPSTGHRAFRIFVGGGMHGLLSAEGLIKGLEMDLRAVPGPGRPQACEIRRLEMGSGDVPVGCKQVSAD